MSWNYRVSEEEGEFFIREVYYDKDGKPDLHSVFAIAPSGESLEDLRWDLEAMLAALDKPIISPKDFTYTQEEDDG